MYNLEVPSIAETQITGRYLTVSKVIRGIEWQMDCDAAARPLAIRRNGKPYPTLPVLLNPMHRFARRFLGARPGGSARPPRTRQEAPGPLSAA
jgi:hypothetical protein